MRSFRWHTVAVGAIGLSAISVARAVERNNLHRETATRPATTQPAITPALLPTTKPTTAEIEALITGLSAATWKQRQEALEQLVQLGEEIKPRLEELICKTRDREAVGGAQTALRMIADNRLVGTTLVSLQVNDVTPAVAFRELADKAHIELPVEPAELWQSKVFPKVTIQADHQPLWSVIREICKQAGVEPDAAGAQIRVVEGAGEWVNFPSTVSGPFLILADTITRTNSVKFSQPGNIEQTCNLQITAYAEPKLRFMPDSAGASIELAVDEKGNSLLPAGAEENEPTFTNVSGGLLWDLEAELAYPKNAGRKIAKLNGTLHFLVPTKMESFTVVDILAARGVTRVLAGRRVQIRKAKSGQNGAYEVQITIHRDALTDVEWQQFSNPRDFVHLVDDKGHALLFNGIGESDGGDKQTTMTLQFETPGVPDGKRSVGKPSQLIWDIPLETRELQIPFTFENLALP